MNARANPDLKRSPDVVRGEKIDGMLGKATITGALADFSTTLRDDDIPAAVRCRGGSIRSEARICHWK